jgi:AcrR family transcriptional regulator
VQKVVATVLENAYFLNRSPSQPGQSRVWKMSIVETDEIARRGPGRPPVRSAEETLRVILEAAAAEFLAVGYARGGMAAIARRAGVSTKTLYRLIPTKSELFRQVIRRRIGVFVLAMDAMEAGADDVAVGLERLLTAFATLTLGPEPVAMLHLVLAEGSRFPELSRTFYQDAVHRTHHLMAEWLERQCQQNLIRIDDPSLAAEMLRGMMIMEPQRAAMLGQAKLPDATQIATRAKACVKLFLEGCRV